MRLVPVDESLRNHFWFRPRDFQFASSTIVCPVAFFELEKLCHTAPIVFIRDGENFISVLMMGLTQDTNLLVSPSGQWLGRAVPSALIAFPFYLMSSQNGDTKLAISEDYILRTQDVNARPFFNPDGTLSAEVFQIKQFLEEREKGYRITQLLVTKLAELNLLSPLEITLNFGSEKRKIEGLYRINVEALQSLPDEHFLLLRKFYAFPLIYAHLFSLINFDLLADLLRLRLKSSGAPDTSPQKERQNNSLEETLQSLRFPE